MKRLILTILTIGIFLTEPQLGYGVLDLGPGQIIQANGEDISAMTYSVPSYVDWNNDGLKDLLVGDGGGDIEPKVRLYLNDGTNSQPHFTNYSRLMTADSTEITYEGIECICGPMGSFPRVVDWNNDNKKDLLIGQLDGTIMIYNNVGTDANPVFEQGIFLSVGPSKYKMNIDVGDVATPTVVDWNNDGKKDLVVGSNDGTIRLFINNGTDAEPDFSEESYVQENGSNMVTYLFASSPEILDLDGDGKKDILAGDSAGFLLFYSNVGTDSDPSFSGYSYIEAGGEVIQVNALDDALPRSRPYVTDWTGDGYLDVLVGAGDGKVYLYQGVPEVGTLVLLGCGGLTLLKKRRLQRN